MLNTVRIYSIAGLQMNKRSALIDHDISDKINRLEGLLRFLVISTVDDDELAHPGVRESLKTAHALSLSMLLSKKESDARSVIDTH